MGNQPAEPTIYWLHVMLRHEDKEDIRVSNIQASVRAPTHG